MCSYTTPNANYITCSGLPLDGHLMAEGEEADPETWRRTAKYCRKRDEGKGMDLGGILGACSIVAADRQQSGARSVPYARMQVLPHRFDNLKKKFNFFYRFYS